MTQTVIVLSDKAQLIMATPADIAPMPTIEDIVSIRGVERRWFVIHTKPQVEHKVASSLAEIGAEAFAPETIEWKPRTRAERDQKKPLQPISRPLLPRYIFAKVPHAGAAIAMLQRVDGVVEVLGDGECKTPVQTSAVDFLREQEQAGAFNKTIKRGRVVVPAWVREGLPIQIKDGPFAQFWGVIVKCLPRNCLRVVVDMFGRSTPIDLDIAQVRQPVASS